MLNDLNLDTVYGTPSNVVKKTLKDFYDACKTSVENNPSAPSGLCRQLISSAKNETLANWKKYMSATAAPVPT